MSSHRKRNAVKLLNSNFEKKPNIIIPPKIEKDESKYDHLDMNPSSPTSDSEHYVLEYKKGKVLQVLKKQDDDENDIKMQNEDSNRPDDDTISVQEILEHVCGKCYKTFSSFQHFKSHSLYCTNNAQVLRNLMKMEENLQNIEIESFELEKQNICFCCKENWETAHSGHIRCQKCPKSFKNAESFERHTFLIHYDGSQTFDCKTCNAKCPSILILDVHKKAHKRGKPFACKKCGEEFTRKYHLNRHHKHSGCEDGSEKTCVSCKVCGKEFHRLDNLRIHLKQHIGESSKTKDYQCPYCYKAFYGTATLNIHVRTHTGEKPFACDICGVGFPSNASLRKHRRTHTGERPYQCSVCCRLFAAKEVLNRHMKTHTGEKPHKCDLCDKRFIQATQLKNHMITHEKKAAARIGAFTCRKCNEIFSTKDEYSKHSQSAHPKIEKKNGNITCSYCSRKFNTDGGLKRHITRVHINNDENDVDFEYVCGICGETFDTKKNLVFHKLKVHDDEDADSSKNSNQWDCKICHQQFTDNYEFINHMEVQHGAIIVPVNNDSVQLKDEEQKTIIINDDNMHFKIESETEDGNIKLVSVANENNYEIRDSKVGNQMQVHSLNDVSDEDDDDDEPRLHIVEEDDDEEMKQTREEENDEEMDEIKEEKNEIEQNNDIVVIKLEDKKDDDVIIESRSSSPVLDEKILTDNIIKLLDLLVEEDILVKFGYPKAPVDKILLKVIQNCGHYPNEYDDDTCDYMTKLRDYVKLLFTVVVDNDSIKELLNNHPVDKVISQVLEMAGTNMN